MRYSIQDFSLANPIYRNATVTFYTVSGGAKTATKATLYASTTGTATLTNPQRLGSEGKFRQAVYIAVPVVATVSGLTIPDHDTGVIANVTSLRFRVDQSTAKLQYSSDAGSSWSDTGDYIFRDRSAWLTATSYARNDVVTQGGGLYICLTAHTSGVFATDLAAKWLPVFDQFGQSSGASLIGYGGTTVKTALDRKASAAKLHEWRAKMAAGEAVNIACFGDSTTDGNYTTDWVQNPVDGDGNAVGTTDHNLTAPNSWAVKLQTLLRAMFENSAIDVHNAGYSGKRMDNGWAYANYDAAITDNENYGTPDICFLAFGLNDIGIAGSQIANHVTQTRLLAEKLLDAGTLPVLLTCDAFWRIDPNIRDNKEASLQIDEAKKFLAEETGIPVFDIGMAEREWLERNIDGYRWATEQSDGLHFTDNGHAFKATALAAWLYRDIFEFDGSAPQQLQLMDSRSNRSITASQSYDLSNMRQGVSMYDTVTAGDVLVSAWIWNRHPDAELIYRGLNGEGYDSTAFTTPPLVRISEYITDSTVSEMTPAGAGTQSAVFSLSELPYRMGTLPYGLCKIEYVAGDDSSGTHWVGAFELWATKRGSRAYSDCMPLGEYQSVGGPVAEVELFPESPDGTNVFGLAIDEYVDIFVEAALAKRAGVVLAHANSWGGTPDRAYGSKGFLYLLRGITGISYLGAGHWQPDGTTTYSALMEVENIDLTGRTKFRVRMYRDGANRKVEVYPDWNFGSTPETLTLISTDVCIPLAGAVGGVYFEPETEGVYRQTTLYRIYKRQGLLADDVSVGVVPPDSIEEAEIINALKLPSQKMFMKKIANRLPMVFPDYETLKTAYGYSYLFPQCFAIDDTADELHVAYGPAGGSDQKKWVAVYDRTTSEYKSCYGVGADRWAEGCAIIYDGATRYFYTKSASGYIGKWDITTLPATRTFLSTTATFAVDMRAQMTYRNGRFLVESNAATVAVNIDRVQLVRYDADFVRTGDVVFDPIDAGTAEIDDSPYSTYIPKRQGIALGDGYLVSSHGGVHWAEDIPSPYHYNGIKIYNLNGDRVSECLMNPEIARTILVANGITCDRIENEGVVVDGDGKIYTLLCHKGPATAGATTDGIIIFEEGSTAGTALDFSAASVDYSAFRTSRYALGVFPRSSNASMYNPITGEEFTTLAEILDFMKTMGFPSFSWYTSSVEITDINAASFGNGRLVTIRNVNNLTFWMDVADQNKVARYQITGGAPYVQTILPQEKVMLSPYSTAVAVTAAAATYTSLSYANNGGNVQLASAGVHGLTGSAVGRHVYVSWSGVGHTGVDGLQPVLTQDSTTAITLNLAYAAGLGTPTVKLVTEEIEIATIGSIVATSMGANGVAEIDTLFTYTNSANAKTLRTKIGSTVVQNTSVTTTATEAHKTKVRNRNDLAAQIVTGAAMTSSYGTSTVAPATYTIDFSATQSVTVACTMATANEFVQIEAADIVIGFAE